MRLTTDGNWYVTGQGVITVSLDVTHRYGSDALMNEGMYRLSWGQFEHPAFQALFSKWRQNKGTVVHPKARDIFGTHCGAMNGWVARALQILSECCSDRTCWLALPLDESVCRCERSARLNHMSASGDGRNRGVEQLVAAGV